MAKDSPSNMYAKVNFELFKDVNLFVFLSCLVPYMLRIVCALIKFAPNRNVFACDYVVIVNIC